jgi:hypothetical protein
MATVLSKELHALILPSHLHPFFEAPLHEQRAYVGRPTLERKGLKEVCLSELQIPRSSTSKARSVPRGIGRVL